jgi:hypothetical protein
MKMIFYCGEARVIRLKFTDVAEVLAASIIRAMIHCLDDGNSLLTISKTYNSRVA